MRAQCVRRAPTLTSTRLQVEYPLSAFQNPQSVTFNVTLLAQGSEAGCNTFYMGVNCRLH